MTRSAHEVLPQFERAAMRNEVLAGLHARRKSIAPKYFYDAVGSHLFEAICRTPEYYVTRAETELLSSIADDVVRLAGTGCVFIEPGSGNSEKAQLLLDKLRPAAYVPIEICAEMLHRSVARLAEDHAWLRVLPRCADYAGETMDALPPGRRLVFFPGSSIGNFEPNGAVAFLSQLRQLAGPHGALLIGVDLKKDPAILNAAYNDQAGITAAFNLNLLARLNRELDADFDLETFEHCAFYAADHGRVEMHLVSRITQRVRVAGEQVAFAAGESIHTENSYKYTIEQFRDLAAEAGWVAMTAWTDPRARFSVQFFVRED